MRFVIQNLQSLSNGGEGCAEETAPQREVKEGDEGKTEIDGERESAEERAALLSKSPAKINPLRGGGKQNIL